MASNQRQSLCAISWLPPDWLSPEVLSIRSSGATIQNQISLTDLAPGHITLLSVLGKGIERLIARNMAWIAIHYKVLASPQLGALPLHSAIDLTMCLLHDAEHGP
jgi:hypothetical protein